MRITISKEDYLKAIAEAGEEGTPVIAATLARWLGVTAPAVMMAVRRLRRDGLIRVDAQGHIGLSPSGREVARRLRTRHNLIERMLTEIFGMEWHKVHEEAERLEHAVSPEFERCLIAVLGAGKPCPHGELTGRDSPRARRRMGWLPLNELNPGARVVVCRVHERDGRLLEYFHRLGLRPGTRWLLEALNGDGTLTLRAGSRSIPLSLPAAGKVWVSRAEPAAPAQSRRRPRAS